MLACETLTAPSDFMIRPFGALICCNSARFSGPTSSARQNRAHLKAPAGSLLVLREGKMEKSFRNFQQKASLSVNREGQELVSLLLEIDVVYGSSSVLMLHSVFCPPPPGSPKRIFVHYQHGLCFTTLFSVLVHITVTRSIGQQ